MSFTLVGVLIMLGLFGYLVLRMLSNSQAHLFEYMLGSSYRVDRRAASNEIGDLSHELARFVRLSVITSSVILACTIVAVAVVVKIDPSPLSVSLCGSFSEAVAQAIDPTLAWRVLFAVEQIANGLLFDVLETFGWRVVTYDQNDTPTAAVVLVARTMGQICLTAVLSAFTLRRTAQLVVKNVG
jgi:hypothetical protein